jgi:hypothetical protein
MKYTTENIVDIAGDELIDNNIKQDKPYDWLDIVGIPQRPNDLTTPLFFATHSDGKAGLGRGV